MPESPEKGHKMDPIISKNPFLSELITEDALKCYGRSSFSRKAEQRLDQLKINDLFGRAPTNASMAKSVLAGLWLLHGFLEQSHAISQDLNTSEGSFWHAIMHRLEGDFWNSKYWYRKVGSHPVDQIIQSRLESKELKLIGGSWDPSLFVDLVQRESGRSSGQSVQPNPDCKASDSPVHRIAIIEWESLFEFCWSAAI